MDELTLNLTNFALNMHTMKQMVASKNMANVGNFDKLEVDFSHHLNALENMTETQQLQYLNNLNAKGLELQQELQVNTGKAINLQDENAASTKALMEYQALVEVLNRKIGMTQMVLGGGK